MNLFLEPVDVWLFRDGRPFDALSDHRAQSLFPPYPTVMQGVLRSHHLVVKKVDLRDPQAIEQAIGTAERYPPGFRVRGPFVARRTDSGVVRYLPLPQDAVKEGTRFRALVPRSLPDSVRCSAPTPKVLWPPEKSDKLETQWWLREDALREYLEKGKVQADEEAIQGGKVCPSSHLFQRENRLGIALEDATRTTQEGALYEVEFVRPCPGVGLAVEVHGLDGWSEKGLLRIGGEGRGARFEVAAMADWPPPPNPLPQRFRLYLATPAYFENGWCPADWGKFFQGSVTLVAAAIGRYEAVGGYDLATRDHKPARRYVPAGSVYFFETDGRAALKDGLTNQAVTDNGAEIGFGQICIGRW